MKKSTNKQKAQKKSDKIKQKLSLDKMEEIW